MVMEDKGWHNTPENEKIIIKQLLLDITDDTKDKSAALKSLFLKYYLYMKGSAFPLRGLSCGSCVQTVVNSFKHAIKNGK